MNRHSDIDDAPASDPARRAPAHWSPVAFVSAGCVSGGTLSAAAAVAVGAPWYVPAATAAEAILGATVLRWSLERTRRGSCGAVLRMSDHAGFACQLPAGHPGDHREDAITATWNETGVGLWRRRRRRRSQ